MPNCASHPPRAPRDPCKGYRGEIPYTTLEIPTVYNPDLHRATFYQDGFQKFSSIPVDKSREIADRIRTELAGPGDLDVLRECYHKIIDGKGKIVIETRLLRLLQRKMDSVFARMVKEAIENADPESLEELIKEVEEDALLAANIRTVKIKEIKEMLPDVHEASIVKERDMLDKGAGGHRKSTAPMKRRSTAASKLAVSWATAKIQGWDSVTFNAQTGRMNIIKEVLFEKRKSVYAKEVPVAEFADPAQAKTILSEVVQMWNIFKVRVDVVQAHKAPYASKQVDGGDHEEWLQRLALARAKKLTEELAALGIPREMMAPQVHVVENSPVLQYLNFALDFRHITYEHEDAIADLVTEITFQRRKFGKEGFDAPEAKLENRDGTVSVLQEVERLWRVQKCDLDVVIHRRPLEGTYDDEHEQWYAELLENRGKCLVQEFVQLGIPEERLACKVMDTDASEFGKGLHFEFVRDIRVKMGATEEGAKAAPMSRIIVDGAGMFEFNGKYKSAGTLNGQPKYRIESGGKATLCLAKDGFWYLCYNHNPKEAYYKCKDLDGSPWRSCRSETNGGLIPVSRRVMESVDGAITEVQSSRMSNSTDAASKTSATTPSSAVPSPPPRMKGFLDDSDTDPNDQEESEEEDEDDAF